MIRLRWDLFWASQSQMVYISMVFGDTNIVQSVQIL